MTDTEKEQEIWKIYPKYHWVEVSNLGNIRTSVVCHGKRINENIKIFKNQYYNCI